MTSPGAGAGEGLAEMPLPVETYLAAAGVRVGGRTIVAVGSVEATFSAEQNPLGRRESFDPHGYRIRILERDEDRGAWGRPRDLVSHPTSAIWLSEIEATGDRLVVRYALDSLHELLFLADYERDRDDGLYEVTFDLDPETGLILSPQAHKVSGYGADLLADLHAP